MFIDSLVSHSTLAFLLVPLFYSLFFGIYHILPHIVLHISLPLATNNSLSPTVIFHFPLYSATSILWYNQIISTFNSLFFGTYTFSSFNTSSSSICYSSSLNTFTSAFFISFITLTISLSLPLAFFIFSTMSILSPSITTSPKL